MEYMDRTRAKNRADVPFEGHEMMARIPAPYEGLGDALRSAYVPAPSLPADIVVLLDLLD